MHVALTIVNIENLLPRKHFIRYVQARYLRRTFIYYRNNATGITVFTELLEKRLLRPNV